MAMSEGRRLLPLLAYAGGLVLVFLGERVFPTISAARMTLSGAGLALVVGYLVLRLKGDGGTGKDRRAIDRLLAAFAVLTIVGLVLSFFTTDDGERLLGMAKTMAGKREKFEAVATIVWISLLTISALPILFAERALLPMRRAENVEGRRVLSAEAAGLTLALAAIYGALFTYAAGEFNLKADYSYFRTSKPGDGTKNMVRELQEPIKVMLFFPPLNEVGREVTSYLQDLAPLSPKFSFELHDRLLEPSLAKDWKVTQDGMVVLGRGANQQPINVGADMETARSKLKTFDTEFQRSLLKTTREMRNVLFTTGHGEMSYVTGSERSASGLRHLLESQNYTIRDLGLAQGLGNEIPKDASIVAVLGPTEPFLPGEVDTLKKYADRGGHLLLVLDPEAKVDLDPLAGIVGLSFDPTILANEKTHLRRRFNDSDRATLVTNRFSSHASVSSLSRNSTRMPVVFSGAGSLDKRQGADPELKIDFTVKAMTDTFADANGDFQFQTGEKKAAFGLAAAVSKTLNANPGDGKSPVEMRAYVISDADVLTDFFLGNEPNDFLFVDAIRWLGGEESFAGATASSEDVRIEHTKQRELIWFYGTIFLVPLLVLGLGLVYGRRARAKPSLSTHTGAAAAQSGGA
jgi:hypothetical protein